MNNQISRIKYFNLVSLQTFNLDKNISVNMLITLYNKFGLNKRDIGDFLRNNKNLGIFLNLRKKDSMYENNWK